MENEMVLALKSLKFSTWNIKYLNSKWANFPTENVWTFNLQIDISTNFLSKNVYI